MGGEENSVVSGDELNMVRCKVDYKDKLKQVGKGIRRGGGKGGRGRD